MRMDKIRPNIIENREAIERWVIWTIKKRD